jgi:DNA-binding NarL/FixJ family response regulator
MEVVGSAASVEEAVSGFAELRPDITLMDLQLGAGTGVDAIRSIRAIDPKARIVVLTMYHGDEDIFQALDAGATTYLLKDMLTDDLIRTVREVHAGQHPIGPEVQARLTERAASGKLTARELDVIELIAKGTRNKDIAEVLGISEETVQVHVRNILFKLKVRDRTGAINVAIRRGIIHIP